MIAERTLWRWAWLVLAAILAARICLSWPQERCWHAKYKDYGVWRIHNRTGEAHLLLQSGWKRIGKPGDYSCLLSQE